MKAFCVVIGKPLIVARCPLPCGSCAWQHRQTNFCKYTNQDLDAQEIAHRVGAKIPQPAETSALEQRLLAEIKAKV